MLCEDPERKKSGRLFLAAKLEADLEKRLIETGGVIACDSAVFTECLEGNPIRDGQAARQAREIHDRVMSKTNTNEARIQ